MAGTIVGVVDAYVSAGYTNAAQAQVPFAMLYYFFQKMVAQGYCTMVATNYGFVEGPHTNWGGGSGTGMDSYPGPNPAGENAWFLVKFNTSAARPGGGSQLGEYYVLVQWAGDDTFGANNNGGPNGSDGYPAQVSYFGGGYNGVAIAVAFCLDGSSPWNGTTDASEGTPGQAQKGLPVWAGSTLRCMDVSNGPYGSYSTNKQVMMPAYEAYLISGSVRFHAMGDADGFVFFADVSNEKSTTDDDWFAVSLYEPYSKYPCSYPLIVAKDDGDIVCVKGAIYGSTGGDSRFTDGAIVGPDSLNGTINEIGRFVPHNYPGNMDASGTFNPIDYPSTTNSRFYWECPIMLEYYDVSGNNHYFMMGQRAFMGEVYGPGPATISADGARLFMNTNRDYPSTRVAIPWAGGWPPGYRSRTYPPGYQVP